MKRVRKHSRSRHWASCGRLSREGHFKTMPSTVDRIRAGARVLFRGITSGLQHWLYQPGVAKPERAVPVERIPSVLEKYRAEFDRNVTVLAERLTNGELSPRSWRFEMLQEIRFLHMTAAIAAAGGMGNLESDDIALVNRKVNEQAAYLDRFTAQLERQPAEERKVGYIANRARQYSGAANTTASLATDLVQHRKFPSLPFHSADRTLCRTKCACDWDWQNVDEVHGNADVYWKLNQKRQVVEHCETCLKRRKACNPLKIRNWQFENLPANMGELIVA